MRHPFNFPISLVLNYRASRGTPVLANYNLADFEMITAPDGELNISPLITTISQDSAQ